MRTLSSSPTTEDIETEIDLLLSEIGEMEGPSPEEKVFLSKAEARKDRRSPARISVRLAVGLVFLAIMGTALALTYTPLTLQQFELWQSQSSATDFTVTQFVLTPVGDNQIDVNLTVQNDDGGATHFANVTLQLLDVNGDLILEQTLPTGAVAASGSTFLNFSLSQAGLVASYEKSQVLVNEST